MVTGDPFHDRLPFLSAKPASLSMRGVAQRASILTRTIGDRRYKSLSEHLIRDLAAEWLEQCEFCSARLTRRHHRRVLKHRLSPIVGAVHDVLVCPLEIKCVYQRFAKASVLQLLASRIDEPALRAGGRRVRQNGAFDTAILKCRKVIAGCPSTRGEFLPE